MPEEHKDDPAQVDRPEPDEGSCEPCDRRTALATGSSLLMAGGLLGGYGTFFSMAGRYFFPSQSNKAWIFVCAAERMEPGESIPFESPAGVRVTVTRRADLPQEAAPVQEKLEGKAEMTLTGDNFLALSSICPHLGCRVHWEGHNNRYFCPCHNGVFDPGGKALEGPPATDGQDLPEYPLLVKDGALYIEMPYRSV